MSAEFQTLEEASRHHIARVLAAVQNKTKAAKILDMDRRTLYRWIERMKRDGWSWRGSGAP